MLHSLMALSIGFLLDFIFGDPHGLIHPVQLIGYLIDFFEKWLRKRCSDSKNGQLLAGVLLVILVVSISVCIPLLLLKAAYQWNVYAGLFIESIMCYQLLATKSLKKESMKVYQALAAGKVEKGRKAVSMIVGRDTENLTESEIVKATVETVAENTSDGSIAPLLFMAVAGATGGFFYKAVNTMDSMVGYKNDAYIYVGRAAAKTDDILNYIPARISAYLMVIVSFLLGYDSKGAWSIYKRDRYNHASPNSAHTESVVAGALQIQLAGDAFYFGKRYEKKTIGDKHREVVCEDIAKANHLLYGTAILGMVLFGLLKYVFILWS